MITDHSWWLWKSTKVVFATNFARLQGHSSRQYDTKHTECTLKSENRTRRHNQPQWRSIVTQNWWDRKPARRRSGTFTQKWIWQKNKPKITCTELARRDKCPNLKNCSMRKQMITHVSRQQKPLESQNPCLRLTRKAHLFEASRKIAVRSDRSRKQYDQVPVSCAIMSY